MDPMNVYGDIFAEIYNLYWTEFIDIIAPQIVGIYQKLELGNNHILDLCCGTGRLSKHLLDKGYSVLGIDLSPDMIEVARRKTIKERENGIAEFRVGDATDFEVNTQFGMCVSTFDSLNHLKNYDQLEQCFTNVFDALLPGGIFIFDLNTERGLKKWEFVDIEEAETATFIIHASYDEEENRAYSKVIGFRKKGELYEKFTELMYNTVFKIEKVTELLEDLGFEGVFTTSEMDLTKVVEDPEKEDRTFIIARKPLVDGN